MLSQLMMISVFVYPVVQILSLVFTRHWTRLLTTIPLLVMLPVYAATWQAHQQHSNLWPILMILASPAATAYLVVVLGTAKMLRGAGSFKPGIL